MKNVICIVILISFFLICMGCSDQYYPNLKSKNEVSMENSEKDEKAFNSYRSLNTIVFDSSMSVDDITSEYIIDVERKFENGLGYFVLSDNEGGKLFVGFNCDSAGNYERTGCWYCRKKIISDDFEKVVAGNSTLDDVQQLDPYGNYFEFYMGRVRELYKSYHITYDGYYVTISYDFTDDGIIVDEITIEEAIEDDLINIILDEDRTIE